MGKVLEYIHSKLRKGRMHMTLIDPEKQEPERAAEIASFAEKNGCSAIMVGGSTGIGRENTDATLKAMKKRVSIPLISFPSGVGSLSPHFDAVFFLSMLNSADPAHITGEQAAGARVIREMGIEPIGMGYIIVEPGMKVGEVGKARPIRKHDTESAVGYSLAAQYFGMKLVYLEAGSGAPEPVPPGMISAVKGVLSIPLVVGGGIRTAGDAEAALRSGADIVVTGTIAEQDSSLQSLSSIIQAVKSFHP